MRGFVRRVVEFGLAALVLVVPLHLWAGPHVFAQLDRARRSISFATPWRLLYEALTGPLTSAHARTLVTWLAVAMVLVFVVVLARVTRHLAPTTSIGAAARWVLVLSTAYTVAAPYSLPWYDLLTWATLPVLAASVLDRILLLRLAAMAVAYVPGRVVGMTPTVERVTLWVRRTPVPYVVLLVWGWLTLAARRGSSPTTRASSSSTLTLTAMMSGTAMIAPLAGIATPESLMAKPIVRVMSSAIRPGRRVGHAS